MKLNLEKFKKYLFCIKVETKEEDKELRIFLAENGFRWSAGQSLANKTYFNNAPRYYFANGLLVANSIDNEHLKVINFNEIKESEEKEMRKEQLKAGMNVLLRNGDECLVVETTTGMVLYIEDTDDSVDVNYYNDELKHSFRSHLDIMKVYSLPKYASCYDDFDGYGRDVIYDRAKTEIKEVTLQEIADQFGIAVETLRVKEQ